MLLEKLAKNVVRKLNEEPILDHTYVKNSISKFNSNCKCNIRNNNIHNNSNNNYNNSNNTNTAMNNMLPQFCILFIQKLSLSITSS